MIAEYDNGAAPSSPSREYIYTDSDNGAKLLAIVSNGTTEYFHQDHLSIRLFTNASGSDVGEQGHYPFGESMYQNNSTTEWRFTTYQRDQESGLDYALARFYNSRVAGFCSVDPIEGNPEDPLSWNRYSYAENDPINRLDPSGKSWWSWVLDAAVAFVSLVLPEIDPALFSFFGTSSAATVGDETWSVANTTGPFGAEIAGTLTGHVTFSSITLGLAAGGGAGSASFQSSPQSNPPTLTPEQRFKGCVSKYGDSNAKQNLTYQGYQDAEKAAQTAKIGTSQLLALWENENSLNLGFPSTIGPAGEMGPAQVTPPIINELRSTGQLPAMWNISPTQNLTAGAKYFGRLISHYGFTPSNAAAAYNAGPTGARQGAGQDYQNAFNQHLGMAQNLVNCIH